MSSDLTTAACSIARTKRGRFFWAVWSSGVPARRPFRQPDAANGGAASHAQALAQAERAVGLPLTEIDPIWARAWMRSLRGQPPLTRADEARLDGHLPAAKVPGERPASLWTVLRLPDNASLADIKRAYRVRALETHPDHGGDPEAFRAVVRAYQAALAKRAKAFRRR